MTIFLHFKLPLTKLYLNHFERFFIYMSSAVSKTRYQDVNYISSIFTKEWCSTTDALTHSNNLFIFLSLRGLQGISSQGGKLEIAGTVVGHWAVARRSQGRGGYPVQVVSVGGSIRGYVQREDKMSYISIFYYNSITTRAWRLIEFQFRFWLPSIMITR